VSLILAQAEARVVSLLKTLPAIYYYHNLVHTFSFVYPRVLFYGQHEKLKPSQKEVLGLAALLRKQSWCKSLFWLLVFRQNLKTSSKKLLAMPILIIWARLII
jgi:hypothetical protein